MTANETKTRPEIVIVDDAPANLRLLMSMLTKNDYDVRPSPNGKLALRAIQAAAPDLVLLDINMPEMNGYEVCQALKENEASKNIPVIFISALDEAIDKVRAFNVGGVDYITKPFQLEEVLARVKTHLTISRLQQELKNANDELAHQLEAQKRLNRELETAMSQIKTLKGLIPICASCKKIRDDSGYWHQVEAYVEDHSEASFTHGICKDCAIKLYPEIYTQT